MATKGQFNLTLLDWAKRLDPNGQLGVSAIIELLDQTNEILIDMPFKEGNLPTGHRTTVRTGLPSVFWRMINQPVPTSKSTTAQITEECGLLEAWSEIDVELLRLEDDKNAFRLSESIAFIEAMNQEMAETLFYGNSSVSPEQFNGLAVRYSDTAAANGKNIIDGGSNDGANSSIYLIVWSDNTVHGIFPKGTQAGIEHNVHGETTKDGAGNTKIRIEEQQFIWRNGLNLKDWRFVVRIANIDIADLVAGGENAANLIELMIKAIHTVQNLKMGKACFYMNRTVFSALDIQRYENVKNGGGLVYKDVDGHMIPHFRGIPIRQVDALLESEEAVSFA